MENNERKISVCVPTLDEEHNLRDCLKSVGFADEIIVIDSGSTDKTLEIAREFTDHVYSRAWQGIARQRQFAMEQARSEWVLHLDADERVSDLLSQEIRIELSKEPLEEAGFSMPRKTRYLGRWILHGGWYPDRKIRLVRRKLSHCRGDGLHDHIEVSGSVKPFVHPIHHYTYRHLSDHLKTIDEFSSVSLDDPSIQSSRLPALQMIVRPIVKFVSCYLLKQGFRDGIPGLIISVNSAFYVFLKHAKIWERDSGLK